MKTGSGDHIVFDIRLGGRDQRITKTSHSARGQIPNWLLAKIAQQMRLSSRQMRQFVGCTMSREEWLEIWGISPCHV